MAFASPSMTSGTPPMGPGTPSMAFATASTAFATPSMASATPSTGSRTPSPPCPRRPRPKKKPPLRAASWRIDKERPGYVASGPGCGAASLKESIPVNPAIALPGWFVDKSDSGKTSDIFAFTPMGRGCEWFTYGEEILTPAKRSLIAQAPATRYPTVS